jgi:hypothetical protein
MPLAHAECADALFAVIVSAIDPRIPIRILKSRDSIGERETVLTPIDAFFRPIPDVTHEKRIRLSRILVNIDNGLGVACMASLINRM